MLDCLGVFTEFLCTHLTCVICPHKNSPLPTTTPSYRVWLPPYSHRSRWTTSMTSRTSRVSWHWPRRMPPPSPSLMPIRCTHPEDWAELQGSHRVWERPRPGRGSPAPALCSPGPLSLSCLLLFSRGHQCQETGKLQHWLCDAWAGLLRSWQGRPDSGGGWWGRM